MKINLKLCDNKECWEVMWCFPKKKCQFCWNESFSEFKLESKLVIWMTTMYSDENKQMAILRNYKWCDHLFIRVRLWEWNDCDHNWWYIHIPCIDDADEVEKLINAQVSKDWEYIFK